MVRTELVRGIKCKNCGSMEIPPFSHHLCQSCGTHIVKGYDKKDGWTIDQGAKIITIKVTHKLFKDILEEVQL